EDGIRDRNVTGVQTCALPIFDWNYYSDEGLEFGKWGVEGETFTRDDSGERVLADNVDWLGLNGDASDNLRVDYGMMNGVFLLEQIGRASCRGRGYMSRATRSK